MATVALQSKDRRELLDTIDKLRSGGISRYVELPEIIVCGDQSSGKSSVLEAISGMSFPTKDNLCTRFATELILRRSPKISLSVSIDPDVARSAKLQQHLRQFNYNVDVSKLDLGDVVNDAMEHMGLGDNGSGFSNDVLRVEVSGPNQPHLTLVDLPGLFRAGNKVQSKEDAMTVKGMVLGYMQRERSIILAVVSAKSDFALQEVTVLAREVDPTGERTLGLITKPDTLDEGSESERAYFELAQNSDVVYALGWHVLKNRDYSKRHDTLEQRNIDEKDFFSHGIWAELKPSQLGISHLKARLGDILEDQIIKELPNVRANVSCGINECEGSLQRLGRSRKTLAQQKDYIFRVSNRFTSILSAACDGTYSDSFFSETKPDHTRQKGPQCFRAVVQMYLDEFHRNMRTQSCKYEIVSDEDDVLQGMDSQAGSRLISRTSFAKKVQKMMDGTKGRELPGLFNPLIVGELFREQCQEWPRLGQECVDELAKLAMDSIHLILKHVSIHETVKNIDRKIIIPAMAEIKDSLDVQLTQILEPFLSSHPITYNDHLVNKVIGSQNARKRKRVEDMFKNQFKDLNTPQYFTPEVILTHCLTIAEHDIASFATDLAIDYLEAYYKVALERYVDDVANLVIEACLMRKLPTIFSTERILQLSDADFEYLASESEAVTAERSQVKEKLKVLQKGLRELNRL